MNRYGTAAPGEAIFEVEVAALFLITLGIFALAFFDIDLGRYYNDARALLAVF